MRVSEPCLIHAMVIWALGNSQHFLCESSTIRDPMMGRLQSQHSFCGPLLHGFCPVHRYVCMRNVVDRIIDVVRSSWKCGSYEMYEGIRGLKRWKLV